MKFCTAVLVPDVSARMVNFVNGVVVKSPFRMAKKKKFPYKVVPHS
jgi:hypothetical protein